MTVAFKEKRVNVKSEMMITLEICPKTSGVHFLAIVLSDEYVC